MSDPVRFARRIRELALEMVAQSNASHIGTCLSAADIVAVLYDGVLKIDPANPAWSDRDRFILSKGHGAAILFAALAERGFYPTADLAGYCQNGSKLTGHISHHVAGVEVSTGSLGHGLPIGCGMALAAKRDRLAWKTFVLLSDGELDEGSNWEAALFAGHHGLDNLVAIVDYNKIQSYGRVSEVLELEPLVDKWRAFRWAVREVDGHDVPTLQRTFASLPFEPGRPNVLIAHTLKGKGVSFMEDDLAWHYKSPSPAQLSQAIAELRSQ